MKLRATLTAIFALVLLGAVARADEPNISALMAPAQRLVDAINHADKALPAHIFTKDALVLDDFAPYLWAGKTNGRSWYGELVGTTPQTLSDFAAMHAQLSVDAPKFARVTGDRAYFVLPATFDFTESGKRIHQTAQWVMTLRNVKGEWLIAGHAYAIASETATPPN